MERLGQLIDAHEDGPDEGRPAIAAPAGLAVETAAETIDHSDGSADKTTATEVRGTVESTVGEDHVRPATAAAFAAVPTDAEAVEPADELPRVPDDPGVDPDDEARRSSRRFRLF